MHLVFNHIYSKAILNKLPMAQDLHAPIIVHTLNHQMFTLYLSKEAMKAVQKLRSQDIIRLADVLKKLPNNPAQFPQLDIRVCFHRMSDEHKAFCNQLPLVIQKSLKQHGLQF